MSEADQNLTTFYRSLPLTPSLVRFFDQGTSLLALGDPDTSLIASIHYKTTRVIKSTNTVPSISITKEGTGWTALLKLLLIDHSYRVEIYEKNGRDWECVVKASPGNLKVCYVLVF